MINAEPFHWRMALIVLCVCALFAGTAGSVLAQQASEPAQPVVPHDDEKAFPTQVQPLVEKFCLRCHSAEIMDSGIRLDQLSATPQDRQIFLLNDMRKQLSKGVMPPAEEPQPSAEQRQFLVDWITRTVATARAKNTQKNGSVRRLTVSQYRNTLRELLGLREDLTSILPPDGISKEGFANNGQTMVLSPLQVESYFNIAEQALDLCIVDEASNPVIQNFRMDFGANINPQPCPDNLVLGALSMLLNNADFMVTELQPTEPFAYQPFVMRKKYEFIEGYVGNDTIREWRKFDNIYHSVFACMRGTPGYPKGEPYQVVSAGLLLRPAIPSPEIFGQSNTYGPMANFKISLRELPERGNFRIRVRASRYDDGLLLDAGAAVNPATGEAIVVPMKETEQKKLTLAASATVGQAGIYQVDVYCAPGKGQGLMSLTLGDRQFAGQLHESPIKTVEAKDSTMADTAAAFLLVRLPAGDVPVSAKYGDNSRLQRVALTRLPDDSEAAKRFAAFEKRQPSLGVYLGLRRDCGSTLSPVEPPRQITGNDVQEYVFSGAISNFPAPEVEKDNVNYLAGIREIGVRSEYTDGRDMPRLLIKSIEFEGPYYETWPPETHRDIFVESPHRNERSAYARDIIRSFATRAFRRPVLPAEEEAIHAVYQKSFETSQDFSRSIKDALLVVLTSPQFLFLIETSRSPQPEDLDAHELASKLSYFLWNQPPDQRLLQLAAQNKLHGALDAEVERMIHDPRFRQFSDEFASQWLSLDKFDVVAIDPQRYPRMTRDTKTQLRQEPVEFLRYLIEHNLPLKNVIQSDFILANEAVASYYNLADRTESGFQFLPIKHEQQQKLGGVLTQAGILSGLSDGRESNPVKRGAWLARKIIAEPPDDPPPNVPRLPDDDGSKLTLREKLERHRNQAGCAKCHAGIDPWGLPFEAFDAGGLLKSQPPADTSSKLPDGTQVKDLSALRDYLTKDRMDQVAFSFLKHIATYAVGRSLTYNETIYFQEQAVKLKSSDYRTADLIKLVIKSEAFLKK